MGNKIEIEVNLIDNGWILSDSYYCVEKSYGMKNTEALLKQATQILRGWLEKMKKEAEEEA